MQKLLTQVPDATGHFGPYGGMFVPETLMAPLHDLAREYEKAKADSAFRNELKFLLEEYAGRPTPLYRAERMTQRLGGAKIYLKREDLLHTGAHKINNALGQVLLARRMGKKRIIAETGAGQHGVATATVAARFGLECVVYMGEVDMARQALNVTRMRLLGATVVPVTAGQKTLKEAVNEAMRDWVTNVRSTHYILGSALGVLQGARTFILQDSNGQIMNTHSISAGLDYAAVGPEHAWLRDERRVDYTYCTDNEALKAFRFLAETEGIIPAMESAHAIAEAMKLVPTLPKEQIIVIC